MRWLRSITTETFGLFVDDGSFAVAILVWLIVAGLAVPYVPLDAGWKGALLFAGLAAIRVESTLRRSRR